MYLNSWYLYEPSLLQNIALVYWYQSCSYLVWFTQWLPLTNWLPIKQVHTNNNSTNKETPTGNTHTHYSQRKGKGVNFSCDIGSKSGVETGIGVDGRTINSITREFYTFQKQTVQKWMRHLVPGVILILVCCRCRCCRRLGFGLRPIANVVMSIALCGFNLWQNIWSTN